MVVQYTLGTSVCTTVAQPITIIGATPIVGISTLTTPYTCTTSGVITVSLVGGGTGPYTYSIDGVTYQVGTTFIITSTGNYTIIIKDSKGCTFATLPIFVAPLTPPTDLTFVSTPLTCPANTSNVTITTTGGSPALSYQIIEPFVGASQVSNVFNNLAPNSYTFEVTDSKNCKYKEDYIIKALPTLKVIGNVVNNVKCFGTSTGSASFAVTGSTGFTYTINGVPKGVGVSPITLVNQPANTYTIVVTNTATSCTDTTFVIIAQPAVALSATVTPTPIKCVPSTGQVLVNATNGWGGYTYVLTPPVGPSSASQMSNLFTGLTQSGTYTVTVTDSGGCTFSTTFPLAAPIAPTLALSVAPVSNFCNTSLSGATLIVTAANGIAPYEFSINGAPYVASNTATNSHTFPNLTASGYTISVRDAYGCTNTAPFTQTIAPQLIINTEFTKELDCSTSPNAVITATAITGGYPAYSYQVSFNGGAYGATVAVVGSSFAYTTAVPGTYQFQVTDTRGCTVLSTIYTVNALIALGETHSQSNNKCFADTAGSVTIIPSGGASPYLIQWNGVGSFTSQTKYTGLAAGTYNFIIEDAKFCRRPGSVTITEPNKIVYNVDVNPITCSAGIPPYALGSICVNGLTGGTPPFTYTLVDLTGGTATQTHVEPLGANYCFANIDFGLYNLSVTDANGCTEVKSNLAMASPLGGLNFAISSIASCAAGASLTAAISGGITGAGPYQFGIVDTTMSPYSCCFFNANPGPPPFYTFTGLIPGAVYTIVVRDMSTNCYYFQKAPATNTNSTILPTITAKNVSCRGAADGNLSFSLSGMGAGVTQFTYQIINSATNLPFGGLVTINAPFAFLYTTGLLPVGTYNILIREIDGANGGCGKTFGPFVITQSAADLILSATTTNDNCKASAGLINPTVTGGTGPYTYQYLAWAPLAPPAPTAVSPGWTATNTFNAESGTYDVYVKDAYGCIKTVNVTIGLDATPQITASVVNACAAQGAYQILVGMTTAGIAPYSFSIDGGAFVTNTTPFTISGLSSGVHTVAVKDKNGCGNTVSVTIYSPLALLANITKEPTCAANDGEITVLASGGTGPYSYQIATPFVGVPQANGTFSNLGAGTYTISVSYGYLDANTGLPVTCTKTVDAILSIVTPVTLNPATTTAVSCNGGSDGTITINLAAGNNNPVYTYQIILPFVGVIQNSNVFTGLSSGNYTIQVLSGRNCPASQLVLVGTPQVIVANASLPTPVYTCTNNSVNATTITISVISGGTPGFTYSIDGINFFPTNTFNVVGTLLPQNFTYYVKDANGCLFTSAVPITIPAYIPLAASYTTTPISCIANSVLTITASGGSGSYNYQVLPASAANVTQGIAPNQNVFTISGPGSYTFLVTDAITGCFVTTTQYDIPPYNVIDVAANAVKPVTCFTGNDGAISINVTGYSGAYTYTILDSLGNPVLPINSAGNTATNPYTLPIGLSAGNYTVQVSESANPRCVKVSNVVTVTGPSEKLTLTALETANVTCTNSKGVITASATGGWGTYTYSIFPFPAGAVQTGGVFTNLPGGPYTITVRDLLNCDDPKTVILTAPAAISTIFPASPILVDCFGDNTASISFPYPTGGQGSNYSYILTTNNPTLITSGPIAIPAGATTIISGLGANTYSIQIKDGFNCDLKSGNIVVTQPSKISSSLNTKTPISCTQPTELTLTGFGGTPPYSYSTTIGGVYTPFMFPTATDISILPVGTTGLFSYYVKDSKGCITDSPSSVTIKPLDPLSLTLLSKTNVNCFGGSNGVINVVALGGLGNYQYTLLNTTSGITTGPQALGNFANLTAGNYQVSVVSGDCTIAPLPVILNQPPVPFTVVATPNAAKCFAGTDGFINLVMTGGVGVIKYAISPNLNQFITITNPYVLGGFNIPNLVGNTNYTVNVVDENGCLPYTFNFTIGQPLAPLSSNITSIVSEKCAEDNLGEIHIGSIGGGTTPYTITYTVVYPGATAVVTSSIIPLAAGVTTYDFLALNGGAYNVIVTDGNGCKSENSLIVGSGISYKPVAEVTFPCVANKPSVRVEVLNSINAPSFTFNTLVGYSFALDGFPAQSLPTNLTPNVFTSTNYPSLLTPIGVPHVIHVYNTNGCDHDTPVFTISATDVDALNLVLTPVLLNQIVATLNPTTGGAGPYTYTFEDEKGSIVQTGSSNIYVYDHSATYTVTVTDSSECSNTAKIPVVFIPIKITNVYTPGDGGGWSPLNTSNYPNLKTRIYDRYGRLIVTLPEGRKWYGKYNGLEVPSGDYWYVVKVDENNAEEFVGHFTLYR